jgi:protein-tyrosine phosphatase
MSPTILIVGGAATGRVPMTAALLERLISQRGLDWQIGAGGVVAHDEDPAEVEARDAMMALGLDIATYRAQSVSDEQVAQAQVILAVDSGTARVIRARYPDLAGHVTTLGELSGRARDIPDPFRMQIGAWITYAREIETLLKAGLSRLTELTRAEQNASSETQNSPIHSNEEHPRRLTVERCKQLLEGAPATSNTSAWVPIRQELISGINEVSSLSFGAGDLVVAYATLLKAMLNMTFSTPSPEQLAMLTRAIDRMQIPIDNEAIAQLSSQMESWTTL